MRSGETIILPLAKREYQMQDEQTTRRALEQAFAALRNDVLINRDFKSAPASLSLRRHQFLLMGSS